MRKYSYILIAIAAIALGITSCGKDDVKPTAAFNFTADKLVVSFSNTSKDADKYTWDFGDGKSSTEANPKHTYSKNGTYKVTLKAENDSKSSTTSKDVLVNDGVDKSVQLGFNTKVENLKVTFENTTLNASSYAWDFGDGNTSTDKNPTHTYIKNGKYNVKLVATNTEGSKDLTKDVTVESQYRQSGYFLGSVASSSAGTTYYGGYFPTLPAETDLTAKTSYQRVQIIKSHNGYMYGWRTDNTPGLVKYAIDKTTDDLVEVEELVLDYFPFAMVIVNENLAYATAISSRRILAFDPQTMKEIKDVDISNGKNLDGYDISGYCGIHYNPKTNKLYATANGRNRTTRPFYDLDKIYVEVIDANTGTWEKTISHDNALYPLMRSRVNDIIDEEGNLYLLCQGTYGLDQQVGPNAAKGSRPQIIKINKNSEFDESYAFNPINSLGYENNFFQLMTNMVGTNSTKAYVIGTAQADSPAILALIQKLSTSGLSTEEYDQLVGLVLYDESMKVLEIDLSARSAKFVEGAPKTAGFGYPAMYNYKGKIYSAMVANGATFNGFYEIDPASNTARPVVNLTAGGLAIVMVDIAASFR